MSRHQQERAQGQYEQEQYEAAQQQAQVDAAAQNAAAQYSSPPPAGPAAGNDLIAKLQQLASLKDSGVLSEAEFAAAKQKLLS